jgi:chorismate mutase
MTVATSPLENGWHGAKPPSKGDDEIPAEIWELRSSIDNIDGAIVFLLAERFRATRQIGQIKAERGLPPADPSREAKQEARLSQLAAQAGLDVGFAKAFRAFVTAEVVRHHQATAENFVPSS